MITGKKTFIILLGLFCTSLFAACYRDNAALLYPGSAMPGSSGCDTLKVSYKNTIAPIFMQNCALSGCHAGAAPTGGYSLNNYAGVVSIIRSERLIGAISHSVGYSPMPKDAPKLTDCQVGLIESWIDQGAGDN